jgi:capsular polysaccharide export protein
MLQDFINEDTDINEFYEFKSDATLMDRKGGFLRDDTIDRQYGWLCKGFKNYFSCVDVDKIIIFNGSLLQDFLASKSADIFGIKKLFFEIGNFPGKLFIDSDGVNAQSSLMNRDLSVCADYDEEKLVRFLNKHRESKEQSHMVPQARVASKIYYSAILERIYNLFIKYPIVVQDRSVLYELKRKLTTKKAYYNFDSIDIHKIRYIFLPLQVSDDSQVIRNSDIPIEQSIDYAVSDALKNELGLLIKPHPAEKNRSIVTYIEDLRRKYDNLYLTNLNTYRLIKNCEKVITINSTVGIEGLMYYKHVDVLGRAIYKPYCEPELSKPINKEKVNRFLFNYLFNCLVDGDLFGEGDIHVAVS